jgi:hypothetical protein
MTDGNDGQRGDIRKCLTKVSHYVAGQGKCVLLVTFSNYMMFLNLLIFGSCKDALN